MRWASAVDTDSNLSSAVERAAGTVFAGLGRQEPDLLFVFVGADHAARFDTVTDLLLREFEGAFLFGCCAGGVIGGGREIEDRPGVSLTGALLPGVKFKGTHLDAAQVPPVFAEPRVWEDTLRMTASQQPAFLLLADPYSFETEAFVRGLDRVYPLSPKIGGLASGARQVGGTALYLGNQVYHSGCVTLALTGNIEIDAVVAQGCRPVGEPMFVTMAHENLIRELDGRPPREVLARLFERIPARRLPDSQHPRHGSAERRALGERQRAGQQRRAVPPARCTDFCPRPHPDAHRLRRHASAAARGRCPAVLLPGPRHGAVWSGRSRQQCIPQAGRRRPARRFLL